MSDKKDLTRIEDMGEFLHELQHNEEEELPELPPGQESLFETSFETPVEESVSFEDSQEASALDFETTDFASDFQNSEDPLFEASLDPFSASEEFSSENEGEEEETLPFDESVLAPIDEPLPEPEPEPEPLPTRAFKTPENFADLKLFAESTSFSGMSAEGNPSFSVLVKNVRYREDVNDIMVLLKELGLLADSEEKIRERLMRGSLLIPRISEFAAIFLSHKLRRFDIDIQLGLSDEIHPPRHSELPETGIVSKHNLYQNQIHHFHFDDPKLEISQIIVAATPGLEGHQVMRYIGVASEHKMLEGHLLEDEDSTEIPRYYHELAQKLKAHALRAHANAVVGLSYQLTPLPSEYGTNSSKYRLTCTGNLVWVNKL